jgi:hypothetical protein
LEADSFTAPLGAEKPTLGVRTRKRIRTATNLITEGSSELKDLLTLGPSSDVV